MPVPVPQNITPLPVPAEFDEWGAKLNQAIKDRTSAPYLESQLPERLDQTVLDGKYQPMGTGTGGGTGGSTILSVPTYNDVPAGTPAGTFIFSETGL